MDLVPLACTRVRNEVDLVPLACEDGVILGLFDILLKLIIQYSFFRHFFKDNYTLFWRASLFSNHFCSLFSRAISLNLSPNANSTH